MRKFVCGLLVVGAVIAFPAAASACRGYDMVYGNEWLGISEGCNGTVYIHVNGGQTHVYSRTRRYPPYPRPNIILVLALRRIALCEAMVAVVESVITVLVLKRRERKREEGISNLLPAQT